MLKSLELTNFKSFVSATVPLGRTTVVVGTNASGKSNLRDALMVLHGIGLGYHLADILGGHYGPGGKRDWRGIRGGAVEAGFEGSKVFGLRTVVNPPADAPLAGASLCYELDADISDSAVGPFVRYERLVHGDRVVFETTNIGRVHSAGPAHLVMQVKLADDGVGTTEYVPASWPYLHRIHEVRGPGLAEADALLDTLRSIRFVDLDPEALRRPSRPGPGPLGERGENLSSVLHRLCQDPTKKTIVLDWLRALTPMDAVDLSFKTDLSGDLVLFLKEASGFEVSARSASDGTLRFLGLLAALMSEESGKIFFFEELDNGLHPTRLHLLLDLIQRVGRSRGVQVIGTTHNPALLASLGPEARDAALLIYRSPERPGSQVIPIRELSHVREALDAQDLGRLHETGWLEDTAYFQEPDGEDEPDGV
jgi:hypothetical protein